MMASTTRAAKAIVTHPPADGKLNWKVEKVTVREIEDDELLVEIVAAGLCHTDVVFGLMPAEAGGYPRVLGHEGAGYVKEVGSKVTVAKVGDPVLLSFASCSKCKFCETGHPSFCSSFVPLNYGGKMDTYKGEINATGGFFGQSSFATLAAVNESSVVNVTGIVKDKEDLKMLAPLGCGFQTGAGSVTQLAGATKEDSITILGLGGVGLGAIMAAKIKGLKTIIGVDRFDSKLELAKSLGATHVLNTTAPDFNLATEVQKATSGYGTSITIDMTGNLGVIKAGLEATSSLGQMILVGVPGMMAEINVHLVTMIQSGKILRGCIEGDVTPQKYVKEMIEWYRQGKFPIDRLVKFYPAEDFEKALSDVASGAVVKPVLVF